MSNQSTLLLAGGTDESCTTLCNILGKQYHLLQASGFVQTKQLLEQHSIAVVLLDITTFDDSDLYDLRQLFQNPQIVQIPFLALTTVQNKKMIEEVIHIGVSDVVVMPCLDILLQRRVEMMVQASCTKLKNQTIKKNKQFDCSNENKKNALHLEQNKYHIILQHMNLDIFEIDLQEATYDVLCRTDSIFSALDGMTSLEDFVCYIRKNLIIPEEKLLFAAWDKKMEQLFQNHVEREDFYVHLKNGMKKDALLYRLTLLPIESLQISKKRVLVVWQKIPVQMLKGQEEHIISNFLDCAMWETSDRLCSVYHDSYLTFRRAGKDALSLLGYTLEDLQAQYHNHMIELIHPEDQQKVLSAIKEQLVNNTEFIVEFRILHKNGHYIWMLSQGYLFGTQDGKEYLYAILIDISKSKETEEILQQTMERQEIILQQTENVIFEYDLATHKAMFSPRWKQIFGYDPINEDIEQYIQTKTHFHPDDIALVKDKFQSLLHDTSYEEFDLRIAKVDGTYLWCNARITVQYQSDQTPLKFVGVITNIDAQKRAEQMLQERAERDDLTELFNKSAGKGYVQTYLSHTQTNMQSAFIMIDLDNFKQVNDRYGHLMGDMIIKQVAATIRNMFRADDIVTRMGGDEFMVLMKNLPSKDILEARLNTLITVFHQVLHEQVPEAHLGCSIGVALFPDHGTCYQDLFRHADQALYQVKMQGKNKYLIYDVNHIVLPQHCKKTKKQPEHTEQEQSIEISIDHLLQYTFQQLYESGDVEQTVQNLLELVGQTMNVSRVYIFENNADNTKCSNTFEWCNDGIAPEIQNLQDISYLTDIQGYENNFNEQGIFYCPDISLLPQEQYEILAPQGIKSMLQCSIRDRGIFRGYVGFDECYVNRLWEQRQIDALTFFSEMLSIFLLKKRAQDEMIFRANNLSSILENQKAWIYVIDTDTYEILFMNEKTKRTVPEAAEGKHCYECLMGMDSRCAQCPTRYMDEKGNGEHFVYNQKYDIHSHAEATQIQWDGKPAYLILCHEIKCV